MQLQGHWALVAIRMDAFDPQCHQVILEIGTGNEAKPSIGPSKLHMIYIITWVKRFIDMTAGIVWKRISIP